MSSSDSEYKDDSPESISPRQSRVSSRRLSHTPGLRQKRSPSSRPDSTQPRDTRARRYHLEGQYKDDYRLLLNEDVRRAATRFDIDSSFQPPDALIGASQWTSLEKSVLFAAVARLGRHDVRGVAEAVGTKSILEVHDFLLLLQDASDKHLDKHGDARVKFRDIPAAVEIRNECIEQLDQAGDALAWYQEKFEARKEEERYGEYWLITPEIAEEIEHAIQPATSTLSSSPPSLSDNGGDSKPLEDIFVPQILKDVPEGNLLNCSVLLELSSSIFMNGDPTVSPFPHWSSLVSPLASNPSIYRTALVDFHTLVVSLTKRLTQTCLIQATSRLRSQGWRGKKGVSPLVKKRDVWTAVDMLRLKRNGKERWKGVGRRCGIRVFQGNRKTPNWLRWDEVDDLLALYDKSSDAEFKDGETDGVTSADGEAEFKSRAARSGTPLPTSKFDQLDSEEDVSDGRDEEQTSNAESMPVEGASRSSESSSPTPMLSSRAPSEVKLSSTKVRLSTAELDQEDGRAEELRLWDVLDASPMPRSETTMLEDDDENEVATHDPRGTVHIPRHWQILDGYRAEWEEFPKPVPVTSFQANQKVENNLDPASPTKFRALESSSDMYPSSSGESTDKDSNRQRRKRRKVDPVDIPVRGSRAYATLWDGYTKGEGPYGGPGDSDDAKFPVQSIEGTDEVSDATSLVDDEMEWDAKPAVDRTLDYYE